jgi:ribonuclease HII
MEWGTVRGPEASAVDRIAGGSRPDLVLGIDEAGRGSLIGPLVVGGFLVARGELATLPSLGVRDSKLLSPRRREEVYERLRGAGRCLSVALPPRTIDAHVRHHGLNGLEATAFAQLVRRARPSEVFADACDVRPDRFGRLVERLSGTGSPVRSSHRADRLVPVVGAASIVAKVLRDRAIVRLRTALGSEIGSGYPSDERTVRFVRSVLSAGGAPPPWLRQSWSTMGRLKAGIAAPTLESYSA